MSLRIAQLQEVRTAPAAHGKGGGWEGPATTSLEVPLWQVETPKRSLAQGRSPKGQRADNTQPSPPPAPFSPHLALRIAETGQRPS